MARYEPTGRAADESIAAMNGPTLAKSAPTGAPLPATFGIGVIDVRSLSTARMRRREAH